MANKSIKTVYKFKNMRRETRESFLQEQLEDGWLLTCVGDGGSNTDSQTGEHKEWQIFYFVRTAIIQSSNE